MLKLEELLLEFLQLQFPTGYETVGSGPDLIGPDAFFHQATDGVWQTLNVGGKQFIVGMGLLQQPSPDEAGKLDYGVEIVKVQRTTDQIEGMTYQFWGRSDKGWFPLSDEAPITS